MSGGRPDATPPLSRWWPRLAPLRPRRLWVGALDLVHLDAPVRVLRPEPLDPLHRLLLRAVVAAPAGLDDLDARLGLGRPSLFRWLDDLRAAGLVRLKDHYALTPAGAAALADGTAPRPTTERRRFTFVLGPDAVGHYLPWSAAPGSSVPAATADVRWLVECVDRPAAWKRRVGFPEDVVGVEAPTGAAGLAAWRRLTVAAGERPAVVLVLTDDAVPRLFGFAAHAGDPDPATPALRLDGGWEEAFPELNAEPTGPRTEVGDGWVLIGDGRLRRAEGGDGPGAAAR
jgi:hypothetical protein